MFTTLIDDRGVESEHLLMDTDRRLFECKSQDAFLRTVTVPLGELAHVRVWQTGRPKEWKLDRLDVEHVPTGRTWRVRGGGPQKGTRLDVTLAGSAVPAGGLGQRDLSQFSRRQR